MTPVFVLITAALAFAVGWLVGFMCGSETKDR